MDVVRMKDSLDCGIVLGVSAPHLGVVDRSVRLCATTKDCREIAVVLRLVLVVPSLSAWTRPPFWFVFCSCTDPWSLQLVCVTLGAFTVLPLYGYTCASGARLRSR